ncbi:DUF2242 domain-containing protein [Lampropedia aestuarii]|uniref:DUF2242 domain-containing protein n=2 Tax=Lampropedia aestuarii TaxID=2562762 RepID=A0A4S5BMR8_9BURK|nr:DUF2242 domain-containing protein [Lampropedia aestuarii]
MLFLRFHAIAAMVCTVALTGCALPGKSKTASPSTVAEAAFSEADTFSRTYGNSPEHSCEAARRALLSQAYLMTDMAPTRMSARKNFQQNREQHYEVEFHITCVANPGQSSTLFVSAVQQIYGLRKTSSSASVGVGILGSLSVPVMSEDESMIKVGSVTLTKPDLYQRFFDLVENHLVAMRTPPEAAPAEPHMSQAPAQAPAIDAPAAPAPMPFTVPGPNSSAPATPEQAPAIVPSVPSLIVDPLNPGAPALPSGLSSDKEDPPPAVLKHTTEWTRS